jgi:hypothetical protein
MGNPKPTRTQGDLAEMLETLLDKGVVINADIAVTVGDTELLGVQLRAAIASFETAAEYGLEFPMGTDMERVEQSAGVDSLDDTGTEAEAGTETGTETEAEAGTETEAETGTETEAETGTELSGRLSSPREEGD